VHGAVAAVALRVDALDAVVVEQRRQQRRQRLGGVAAPLARTRERDADLRRPRLVGGDARRAVAAQRPVDAVDGGELVQVPRAPSPTTSCSARKRTASAIEKLASQP
jgi:hypothetical protein